MRLPTVAFLALAFSVAHTQVYSPDQFNGSLTEKIQKAADAASKIGGRLVLPAAGVIEKTVVLGDDAVVEGTGLWHTWTFTGDGPAFLLKGKRTVVERVKLILTKDGQTGFQIAADQGGSSSHNVLRDCRVQARGAKRCTGYWIGSTADADVCMNLIDHCEFFWDPESSTSPKDRCDRAVQAGHTGLRLQGGNNLAETVRFCSFSGCKVAVRSKDDKSSGGSGTLYDAVGGSYNGLCYWFEGGQKATVKGGRWELQQAAVLMGDPLVPGQQKGSLSFEDVMMEDFFLDGIPGLVEPGTAFAFNTAGRYWLKGVDLGHTYFGSAVGPEAFSLRCRSGNPVLDLVQCRSYDRDRDVDLASPKPQGDGGGWKVRVDGR